MMWAGGCARQRAVGEWSGIKNPQEMLDSSVTYEYTVIIDWSVILGV